MPPPPAFTAVAAVRTPAAGERDPVLAALLAAPLDDEPETEEQRAAFEEGMADVRSGRTRRVSNEEIHATLEQLRRHNGA